MDPDETPSWHLILLQTVCIQYATKAVCDGLGDCFSFFCFLRLWQEKSWAGGGTKKLKAGCHIKFSVLVFKEKLHYCYFNMYGIALFALEHTERKINAYISSPFPIFHHF